MSDFGSTKDRKDRLKLRLAIIVFAILAIGGVAFLLWSNQSSRERIVAESTAVVEAQKVSGPPCEPGTREGKLGRGDEWLTLVFQQVEYSRRIGHADCAVAADKSKSGLKAVCQFSSPAELRVVTKDGPRYFDVGLGRPATVTVADSGVSCVKASSIF